MKIGNLLIGYFDQSEIMHIGPEVCPFTEYGMGAAFSLTELVVLLTENKHTLCEHCLQRVRGGGSWTQ